jgi:hypothetical protein
MTPIAKYCGSSSVFAGVSSIIPDGQFSVGMFVQSSHFI